MFDKHDHRYHIIAMGTAEGRMASFDAFEQMLLAVMKEQRVV